jgi:predicted nucleotidyltransferase component of viral defense system
MKSYAERHIRRSELFQLILLQHLYGHAESRGLIFQGGTAIRWCHGGERFSEDLDFVTQSKHAELSGLLNAIEGAVARESIAHFGAGRLTVTSRGQGDPRSVWRVAFEPLNMRERIMVKVECERLKDDVKLLTEPRVLGMQSAVSYLIGRGEFRIPRPNSVMVVETPQEILSDKVRALLERPYLKGRDIYDVWHLRARLGVGVVREIVERKFSCYAAPFILRRKPEAFETDSPEVIEALENDLVRFLPPEAMAACRSDKYASFHGALRGLFLELRQSGARIPG